MLSLTKALHCPVEPVFGRKRMGDDFLGVNQIPVAQGGLNFKFTGMVHT